MSSLRGSFENGNFIQRILDDPDYRKSDREKLSAESIKIEGVTTDQEYIYITEAIRALHSIGLGINGGVARLATIMRHLRDRRHLNDDDGTCLPNSCIIVFDQDVAIRYVDIGFVLPRDQEHLSFKKIASTYIDLSHSVPSWCEDLNPTALQRRLQDELIPGHFSHQLWELKRMLFVVDALKKAKEALIESASKLEVSTNIAPFRSFHHTIDVRESQLLLEHVSISNTDPDFSQCQRTRDYDGIHDGPNSGMRQGPY